MISVPNSALDVIGNSFPRMSSQGRSSCAGTGASAVAVDGAASTARSASGSVATSAWPYVVMPVRGSNAISLPYFRRTRLREDAQRVQNDLGAGNRSRQAEHRDLRRAPDRAGDDPDAVAELSRAASE